MATYRKQKNENISEKRYTKKLKNLTTHTKT